MSIITAASVPISREFLRCNLPADSKDSSYKQGEVDPASVTLHPIGYVRSTLVEDTEFRSLEAWSTQEADLEFLEEYSTCLDELVEHYKSCWVLYHFDRTDDVHIVGYPRGDKTLPKRGVWALCTPFRPNHLGYTLVQLIERKSPTVIRVAGLDALNGTPIMDIKPEEERVKKDSASN